MNGKINPDPHDALDDLLADPLIQLVMKADRVDAMHIRKLLQDVSPHRAAERRAGATQGGDMTIHPEQQIDYRPGVGIMLLNGRNEVFVGQRVGTADNAWQMPQGGIEDGEEPRAAALRELREEIGTDNVQVLAESQGWLRYDLPDELVGKAWGGRWRGQQQKWFAMRFLGRDADINVMTDHPEFSAWRWVSARLLPDLIVAFKRQLYLDVLQQFENVEDGPPH